MSLGTAAGVNGDRSRQAVGAVLLQAQRSREAAHACRLQLAQLVPAKDYPRERRNVRSAMVEHNAEAAAYQYAASLVAEVLGVEVRAWSEQT